MIVDVLAPPPHLGPTLLVGLQHEELLPLGHGDGLAGVRVVAVDGADPSPPPPVRSIRLVTAVLRDLIRLGGFKRHRGVEVIVLVEVRGIFIFIFGSCQSAWKIEEVNIS